MATTTLDRRDAPSLPGKTSAPLTALLVAFGASHAQAAIPGLAPLSFFMLCLYLFWRRGFNASAETRIALALVLFLLAVAAINGNLTAGQPSRFIREYGPGLYALTVFGTFSSVRWKPSETNSVLTAAGLGGTVVVAAAFLADSADLAPLGFELSIKGRFQGLLSGPNAMAGLAGGLTLLWASSIGAAARHRLLHKIALFLTLAAFLATVSRGFTIGLAGALVGLAIARRRQLRTPMTIILLPVLAFGAFAYGFQDLASRTAGASDDASVTTRFALYERAFDLWSQSPVVGVGLGTFEQKNVELEVVLPGVAAIKTAGTYQQDLTRFEADGGQHTHNVLLQTLVDGGLFALAAMTYLLSTAYGRARHTGLWLDAFIRASLLFLLLSGLTGGLTLFSASASTLPYLAIGLLTQRERLREPSRGADFPRGQTRSGPSCVRATRTKSESPS